MPVDDSLTDDEQELDRGLGRLEKIATDQRKERRWWRFAFVVGLALTAINLTSSAETRRNVEEMRVEADARCERGNVLRADIATMGQAEQDRWDKVTAVLRLEDADDDTPERRAFKQQFRDALDRARRDYATALDGVKPVDCGASAVTTTTSFVP